MEKWTRKLRRSGYHASIRHQLIGEAVAKYKRMCKTEDEGGRPIHRAREWQKTARRLAKERKSTTWHQNSQNMITAPLIIDPTAGRFTDMIKAACSKFGESMDNGHECCCEAEGWQICEI